MATLEAELAIVEEEKSRLELRLGDVDGRFREAESVIQEHTRTIQHLQTGVRQAASRARWYRIVSQGQCEPDFFNALSSFIERHSERGTLFKYLRGSQTYSGVLCLLPGQGDAVFVVQTIDQNYLVWQCSTDECSTFLYHWSRWIRVAQRGFNKPIYLKIIGSEHQEWITANLSAYTPTSEDLQEMLASA